MKKMAIVWILMLWVSFPSWGQDGDWGSYLGFRTEMDRLNRESRLHNPLLLLDFSCSGSDGTCDPIVRMFVRTVSTDQYRLPMLPPRVFLHNGKIKVDNKQLKSERDQEETLLAEACEKLPKKEICEGRWMLKKIFRLSEQEAAGSYELTLKTTLQKPGATGSQVGAVSGMQTLLLEVPQEAVASDVVFFLWEENGVLNVPQTFAPASGPA